MAIFFLLVKYKMAIGIVPLLKIQFFRHHHITQNKAAGDNARICKAITIYNLFILFFFFFVMKGPSIKHKNGR
jgi:protein-S-isoprenylcysteine O-methyltransferase Ste14